MSSKFLKRTLKDLEVPSLNCGLEALSRFTDLKDVSAFTLVHLARDNGQNIHVFKVLDNKDLVKVIRPAIFHQTNHFVYVGVDEPMPEGEYTGYVIGASILGRVISLAESKFIKGAKNFFTGQNKDGEQKGGGALQVIATVVAAAGATLLGGPGAGAAAGAAVNAGYGAVVRAQNPAELGSAGDIGKIGIDALVGGAEGLTVGSGVAGVQAGAANAAATGSTQTLPSAVANFGKGAFQGIAHPINTVTHGLDATAAGINTFAPTVGAFNAATGTTSALYPTNAALHEGSNAVAALNGGGTIGLPSTASTLTGAATVGANAVNATNAAKGGLVNTAYNAVASDPLGAAATAIGAAGLVGSKAPVYSGASPIENYSTTSQYLGPNALQKPTNDQLSTYINTPIEDLAKTFSGTSTRVADAINLSYNNQKQGLVHQFAQAGQNTANSSELQDKLSQLEQKRSTDLSNAALEVQNAGISQAITVKQQALSQGMQSGQFNQNLAMQLAGLTGDQQALQYSIANGDYLSFQQIMGKLLTMGIPQNVNITGKA